MKNIINKLKDGIFIGIGIVCVLSIANSWENLGTVSSGDTLTQSAWNNMVTKINETGNRVSGIFTDGTGKVGIGTQTPTYTLDVNGTVKATNFKGSLNGLKIAKGTREFAHLSCGTIDAPCNIDISSGAFSVAPICTISMRSGDGTGYTENVVIKAVTSTNLSIWKGNYQNEGTTIVVYWICVGE